MTRPEPVLIGFFPKKTACPDAFFGKTAVEEICSVSDCISSGPEGWIDQWKHNVTWWFFDTEAAAREVTGEEEYDMYAYRLFPVVFDRDTETPIDVDASAEGDLGCYEFLGYDIVSRSRGTNFECSPLSCNGGCKEYDVNRHCLVDAVDEAWRVAKEIAHDSAEKGSWEPGPYYLFEVYRRSRNQSCLTARTAACSHPSGS
ncbi:MAG: hypothetical protein V1755_00360 [Chloroflexota bacterium]